MYGIYNPKCQLFVKGSPQLKNTPLIAHFTSIHPQNWPSFLGNDSLAFPRFPASSDGNYPPSLWAVRISSSPLPRLPHYQGTHLNFGGQTKDFHLAQPPLSASIT